MSSGMYPTLTPMPNLPQITLSELLGTMNLLLNAGLNASQYTSLQILTEWINQNWSNVENLPPLQITDLSVMPPVRKYVTYNILGEAFTALNINFTVAQEAELESHIQDYTNPHNVTAAQIGLNFLENLGITTQADIGTSPPSDTYITFDILTAAMDSFGLGVLQTLTLVPNYPPFNPNASTNGQGDTLITYSTLQAALFSTQTFNNGNVLTPQQIQQLQAHLLNYDNPHDVTPAQVGLGSIGNYPPTYISDVQAVAAGGQPPVAYITYNILSQAAGALPISLTTTQIQSLVDHLTNYNNPHTVSGSQVGLGNVANLPPVTTADITAVTAGGTPPDKYITYDQLANANRSLNFHTGFGLSLKVTATNITNTAITFNGVIGNVYNFNLSDTQVSFTFHPTGNPSAVVTLAPIPYSNSLTISVTEPILSPSTSYTIGAKLTSTVDSNLLITASSIQVSTLASPTSNPTAQAPAPVNSTPPALQTGNFFFNIVGNGSSASTTVLDSTTVKAPNCTFNNYQCIDTGSGGQYAITNPIGDPAGDANFTSVSAQLSFIPSSFIPVLSGSTANTVYISQQVYNGLGTGGVVSFLANSNVYNYTIGTNCALNYKAAYSVTTPGTSYVVPATTTETAAAYSYTVPASTTQTAPNILLGSYYGGDYFSPGGTVVGSVVAGTFDNSNYYSGSYGAGNLLGSVNLGNGGGILPTYYSGANATGNLLISEGVSPNVASCMNYYSGGSIIGSVVAYPLFGSSNYYSGADGSGNLLGSSAAGKYYSGANATGNIGIYVNQFMLPFPIITTVPAYTVNVPATYSTTAAYTVTNPSTTVNYPATWWISLNNALPNTPSVAWNGNQRSPVGCISTSSYVSTGTNLGVAGNSTTSNVYLPGPLPGGITAGSVLEFIVNGSPVQLTLGTNVSYNTVAAYSVTTPGTSYVVPATTTETAAAYSYTVPAVTGAFSNIAYTTQQIQDKFSPTGSRTFYQESLGSGMLVQYGMLGGALVFSSLGNGGGATYCPISGMSFTGNNGYNYGGPYPVFGAWFYPEDGNGPVMNNGSFAIQWVYTGPATYDTPLGYWQGASYTPAHTVNVPAQYSTTAAYTVTNPPVTTNYPAQYYLSPSTPLAAAPSAVYTTTLQNNFNLAPLTVNAITYNSGVVTFTLDPFTGNGRYLEVGFNSLYAGDTVVEFKGSVVQG